MSFLQVPGRGLLGLPVAIVAGLIFFFVSGLLRGALTPPGNWASGSGVVSELRPAGIDSHNNQMYTPVVSYTVNGKPYTVVSSITVGGLLVEKVGSTESLAYDPANPANAMITGGTTGQFPTILTAVGVFIIVIGVLAALGDIFMLGGLAVLVGIFLRHRKGGS